MTYSLEKREKAVDTFEPALVGVGGHVGHAVFLVSLGPETLHGSSGGPCPRKRYSTLQGDMQASRQGQPARRGEQPVLPAQALPQGPFRIQTGQPAGLPLDVFYVMSNPPESKMEKTAFVLNHAMHIPKTIRFREFCNVRTGKTH